MLPIEAMPATVYLLKTDDFLLAAPFPATLKRAANSTLHAESSTPPAKVARLVSPNRRYSLLSRTLLSRVSGRQIEGDCGT
jgi:hypothetical protein